MQFNGLGSYEINCERKFTLSTLAAFRALPSDADSAAAAAVTGAGAAGFVGGLGAGGGGSGSGSGGLSQSQPSKAGAKMVGSSPAPNKYTPVKAGAGGSGGAAGAAVASPTSAAAPPPKAPVIGAAPKGLRRFQH